MGIYFDYDFKNGKEVEQQEKCYLCAKPDVLYAEYYILDGDVYRLYKNSRKIVKGKEVPVGSRVHAICDSCLAKYPAEEDLVSAILSKRQEEKKELIKKELDEIFKQIEEKKQEIVLKEKELEVLRAEMTELQKKASDLQASLG